MTIMHSLASIPMIYVFSFLPKSELIGFITFFFLNTVACFCDLMLNFIAVFSQALATNATGVTTLTSVMTNLTWVLVVLFPTVNFKHALFNIRLKSNVDCISALNSIMYSGYSATDSWMAMSTPGLGTPFIIFWAQMIFWWIILTLIENRTKIRLACRRCSCRKKKIEPTARENLLSKGNEAPPTTSDLAADSDSNGSETVSTSWDDSVSDAYFSVEITLSSFFVTHVAS